MSSLDRQEGGDHYKKMVIQPVEFIHANNIGFIEGCVIKYVSRWRDKGGVKDLEKAKHCIDLLIELEGRRAADARAAQIELEFRTQLKSEQMNAEFDALERELRVLNQEPGG